jgi:glycosyltransferase involved in cell wall biosynthesis
VTDAPLLVNARFLTAPRTGVQRVAHDLLVAARNLVSFTTVAPARPADTGDLTVDRVIPGPPGRPGGLLWEQLVLPAAARGRTVFSPVNLAPLAGDNVVLVHDLSPRYNPAWFSRSGRLYGRVAFAAARRARTVLAVSEFVRGQLADAGVAADRLHVVRNAIRDSFAAAGPAEVEDVRRRHGLVRDYVLFVGWADPRKDVATAVAASARVDLPHDLVIIGRAHPAFAPVAEPHGPTVRRLGFVSDADLVPLLTGAAALLYPTRYEGFGLPPLEAAACGTPALVSDLPVLRESGGESSVFLPVGDVAAWAEAIRAALRGELPAPRRSTWTWDDAARQLVTALGGSAAEVLAAQRYASSPA